VSTLHMVVYRTEDGQVGYYQADDLDRAVGFVEHLRNDELISDSRIFRMHEIPIEFRPYYRVAVGPVDEAPADDAPVGLDTVRVPASETTVLGPPAWMVDDRSGAEEIARAGRRLGLFGTG